MNRRTRRPWTADDQRTAEAMRADGASYHQIARALGRSDSVIRMNLCPEQRARQLKAVARCWAMKAHIYRRRKRERAEERRPQARFMEAA